MSPYTALVSKVLFPLHERLKGHDTVRVRRWMERTQWWSAERLEKLRVQRLRALIAAAAVHVPHYRRAMESAGMVPEEVRGLEDLQRLPFLTKEVIRGELEEMKADDAGPLIRYNTGGSTGEPLIFYFGKERVSHDVAAKWRATRWWAVDIGDPEIVVWGSPIELGAQDTVRAVRDRLLRTRLLPAFEMSDEKVAGFVRSIRALRPRMLFGYPSALCHIAERADALGVDMDDLGIRVAFVTAEQLYPHQKEAIERTFGCRVANGYGARDSGFIAHECPSGSMHITAEDVIVEIVDTQGRVVAPGSPGEIVVTHLATRDFPFIRYRTGDIAELSPGPCECGRGLPVLARVHGRSTDFVVATDGTVMHGLALIYVLRDIPGIKQFKIVQESLTRTRVLLVPERDFDPGRLGGIARAIEARLGAGATAEVTTVEHIPAERSGKFRHVVSEVRAPREDRRLACH